MQALGDRMKQYENVSRHYLTRRTPVIVRVDGRAFHTITSACDRPFDHDLMMAMQAAAIELANDMQGCKLGYVQSDEASFLLCDWDTLDTEPWFGNNLNKIISISASVMTAHFNKACDGIPKLSTGKNAAVFDSRAFQLPRDEVANYFLWRAKDWERNSLQMYCRSIFSHRELHKKKRDDMHEMLHKEGLNWTTDLESIERNGTWIVKGFDSFNRHTVRYDIMPRYEDVSKLVDEVLPNE